MTCRGIILRISIVLGIVLLPGRALSDPGPIAEILCAPTAQMRQRLETEFGAERAWQGLRTPDQIMELWEDRRGVWTLVIAYANGRVCIVAMGTRLTGFPDMIQS